MGDMFGLRLSEQITDQAMQKTWSESEGVILDITHTEKKPVKSVKWKQCRLFFCQNDMSDEKTLSMCR